MLMVAFFVPHCNEAHIAIRQKNGHTYHSLAVCRSAYTLPASSDGRRSGAPTTWPQSAPPSDTSRRGKEPGQGVTAGECFKGLQVRTIARNLLGRELQPESVSMGKVGTLLRVMMCILVDSNDTPAPHNRAP